MVASACAFDSFLHLYSSPFNAGAGTCVAGNDDSGPGVCGLISHTFAPNEHLSVLIGPNGSGKTNVLSALRLLPALCSPRHTKSDEPITTPCELRVVYEIDGTTVVQVAKLGIVTNEKNQDEITNSDEYWMLPDVTGPRRRVHIPSAILTEVYQQRPSLRFPTNSRRYDYFYQYMSARGIDNQALPILEKVIGFVTSINYYSASQFTNPGSSPISFEVESEAKRRIGISITGHKKLLFDIYQEHRNKSDIYTEFIGLVGPEGIGLIVEGAQPIQQATGDDLASDATFCELRRDRKGFDHQAPFLRGGPDQ